MHHREWKKKHEHALDGIYDLYKTGREKETELENALDLARDELIRIKVCPGADAEITQLCERGLEMSLVKT